MTTYAVCTCSPRKPHSSPEQPALFNAGEGAGNQTMQLRVSNAQSQLRGFLAGMQIAHTLLPPHNRDKLHRQVGEAETELGSRTTPVPQNMVGGHLPWQENQIPHFRQCVALKRRVLWKCTSSSCLPASMLPRHTQALLFITTAQCMHGPYQKALTASSTRELLLYFLLSSFPAKHAHTAFLPYSFAPSRLSKK